MASTCLLDQAAKTPPERPNTCSPPLVGPAKLDQRRSSWHRQSLRSGIYLRAVRSWLRGVCLGDAVTMVQLLPELPPLAAVTY